MITKIEFSITIIGWESHISIELASGKCFYKSNYAKDNIEALLARQSEKMKQEMTHECFFLIPEDDCGALIDALGITSGWETEYSDDKIRLDGTSWQLSVWADGAKNAVVKRGRGIVPDGFDRWISALEQATRKPFSFESLHGSSLARG